MSKNKFLIVIGGATATGKTAMGIDLAQEFDTEILSCDSRQFYKEMTIGTAKPTPEELAAAPHHFINHLSIKEDYTVGDFEREALELLDKIFLKKDVALLVGGSGLFIRALCEGLDKYPEVPDEIKKEVQHIYQTQGIEALQAALEVADPHYFQKVDLKNHVRLIRALNVIKTSGRPFSSFHNQNKKARNFTPIYINLTMDRPLLYDRINQRVDLMMQAGLLEEARQLFPHKEKNALQTVGYQELMEFFEKKITLEEAVDLIKRNSRRYAKRQMTWFRKEKHWKTFDVRSASLSFAVAHFVRLRMDGRSR
ncbi:MAG TPA: tRNA (adenosine(37)-N6)-dimethylallyltransferase MiaA [Phaeodactylibacter sp.]|nr:tRNA (adenosine(37)-N6)-dimethylallyltransferase MiaA [Phaeodactylibacter sp.]